MPATARRLDFPTDVIEGTGNGGAYAELDVPGDFEATLRDVEDYDYRDRGKSFGWIFVYGVETPDGKEVPFKVWLSLGENARWKIHETLLAHGIVVESGPLDVDPNTLIGEMVGAHIDFDEEEKYRQIETLFNLSEVDDDAMEPEVL